MFCKLVGVRDLFIDLLNVNVEGKVSWPIQLQTSLKLTKGIFCCMYLPPNKCLVEVVLGTYELSRLPLFHSSVLFLVFYFYFYMEVQNSFKRSQLTKEGNRSHLHPKT